MGKNVTDYVCEGRVRIKLPSSRDILYGTSLELSSLVEKGANRLGGIILNPVQKYKKYLCKAFDELGNIAEMY